MAARAYWQGHLRLALVSIPIEIFPATKSGAAISFRQIHEPSGKPVKYEKTVPGIGPIERDDIVKGFEVARGDYVLLDDAEIDAAKVASKRTLELVQFVDPDEIDILYFEKPYFVVPRDDLAQEAYVVLREALRARRKVGLGQLALRGREQLVSLKPCGKGLILETLRYADEVRGAHDYFSDLPAGKPAKDMVALAGSLIDQKTAPFRAEEFRDRYVEALHKLIAKKAKARGKRILEDPGGPAETAGKGNVVDLMAALKRSLGDAPAASAKRTAAKPAASAKRPRKRA